MSSPSPRRGRRSATVVAALAVPVLAGCSSGSGSSGLFGRPTATPASASSTPSASATGTPTSTGSSTPSGGPSATTSGTPSGTPSGAATPSGSPGAVGVTRGATLLSDDFTANKGWPTSSDSKVRYSLTTTGAQRGFAITDVEKGYEFYATPDESKLSDADLTDVVVSAQLTLGARNQHDDGVGVFCRNADHRRYIFQLSAPAGPGTASWSIARDDNGAQDPLTSGTFSTTGKRTWAIDGACISDASGATHLVLTINGRETGRATDRTGLPTGTAGVFLSASTAGAAVTATPRFEIASGTLG